MFYAREVSLSSSRSSIRYGTDQNTMLHNITAKCRRDVAQNQQVVLGTASNTAMSRTSCRCLSRLQCVSGSVTVAAVINRSCAMHP